MSLFDKLAQRGTQRLGRNIPPGKEASILGVNMPKPISTPSDILSAQTPRRLTTAPVQDKLRQLPQRGQLGSTFKGGAVKQRFLADLPASVQLQGIQSILSGQETNNQPLNQFVKTLAAQGRTPEEIRLAFIESQRNSPDPLVIM